MGVKYDNITDISGYNNNITLLLSSCTLYVLLWFVVHLHLL